MRAAPPGFNLPFQSLLDLDVTPHRSFANPRRASAKSCRVSSCRASRAQGCHAGVGGSLQAPFRFPLPSSSLSAFAKSLYPLRLLLASFLPFLSLPPNSSAQHRTVISQRCRLFIATATTTTLKHSFVDRSSFQLYRPRYRTSTADICTSNTIINTIINMTDAELDRDWVPNGRRPLSYVFSYLLPWSMPLAPKIKCHDCICFDQGQPTQAPPFIFAVLSRPRCMAS